MIRDDYKVYRTRDPKESVYFLERFINKLLKEKDKLVPDFYETEEINDNQEEKNKNYCDTIMLSKKANMKPEVFNQLVLLQIPGVSSRFVKEIFKIYPTIKDLILTYENLESDEKRYDLLSKIQIELTTGKKRRIGFIISKRIYDFFYP